MMAQCLGRLLGVLHVLLHHGRSGKQDLALFSVWKLAVCAGLDNLDICIRERDTYAALLEHVRRRQAAGRDSFRRAVALAHLNDRLVVIEKLVELLFQLHRQRIAAGEHTFEAAQVRVLHALHAQHRLVERRHTGNKVAAVFHDLLGIILGIDARDQDAAAGALQHGMNAHAKAEAVEHGHHSQHLITWLKNGVKGNDLSR